MVSRKASFFRMLMCMAVCSVLAGCSAGPSERQVKADLQKWFDARWPSAVSVVTCRTTVGEGDDTRITFSYEATARFRKDAEGCVFTCCGEICFDKQIEGFRWLSKASDNRHVIRTGDAFEMRGTYSYKKSEHGWICENL